MPVIEVIYENGVLRPLQPLELAEGTRLEVTVPGPIPSQPLAGPDRVDEETYLEFLAELDRIAALPPEGELDPYMSRDHDAILYPKHGPMP